MSTTSAPNIGQAVQKRFIQIGTYFTVLALTLFLSAGRIDWVWAWAYLGAGIAILILNAFVMPRELIAERAAPKENVKGWDKVITWLTLLPTVGLLLTAGLDQRFHWSPQFDLSLPLGALIVFMLGEVLVTWAMASNKFFSTVVRIQTDRGHQVVNAGPYHYVRHPGYVGFMIANLVTPLVLGSWWALICAMIIICLFIVRTALEDRTLQNELVGYKEYAAQVRYRLLPGVW